MKKYWPVAVGVPVRAPSGARLSPGGKYALAGELKVFLASPNVNAPLAPVAVSTTLYGAPTLPAGSEYPVVVAGGVTLNVMCRFPYLVPSLASVAWIRNV